MGIKKIQFMLPTICSQLSHVYFCVVKHLVSSTDLEVLYTALSHRTSFFLSFSNTCRILFSSYSLYIPWSVFVSFALTFKEFDYSTIHAKHELSFFIVKIYETPLLRSLSHSGFLPNLLPPSSWLLNLLFNLLLYEK